MRTKKADWKCLECGRVFYYLRSTEKAASDGCPNCGSVDIDLNVNLPVDRKENYYQDAR